MNEIKKILLVDDEPDILEFLSYNLKKEGFEVLTAENGLEGLKVAIQHQPDLVVLDVMMPTMDGIETCQKIRQNSDLQNIMILFLTASDEEMTEIKAFEMGADDFVTKPIRPSIVVSRIKALLRRTEKKQAEETNVQNIITYNDLIIDKEKVLVFKGEKAIDLTKKEFELFLLLHSNLGKVFTREEIFSKIWDEDVIVGDRTIDVHIRKLREKIGENYIGTVKGIGYKMDTFMNT